MQVIPKVALTSNVAWRKPVAGPWCRGARAQRMPQHPALAHASANASPEGLADPSHRPRSSLLLVDVAGQTTRCHVFRPRSSESTISRGTGMPAAATGGATDGARSQSAGRRQPSTDAGVMMLTDIFGCDTIDNLKMCQRLADDLQCPVYMPDLFREEPWPQGTPVTAEEFEEWRSNIGDTWPTDVTAAVAACMAVAGFPRVGLLGFCFGGGRVVDALGNSRTDLLESSAAPPATYCDVRASTASIDEDLLLCTSPPTPWAYVCGVAFYGTRIDLSALARVRQPLRLAFAGEDALVPHDFIEEMRSVRARRPSGGQGGPGGPPDAVQISVEAGVPHGFVHQSGKQGEAGDRVLARAELFLRKHLLQEADILV